MRMRAAPTIPEYDSSRSTRSEPFHVWKRSSQKRNDAASARVPPPSPSPPPSQSTLQLRAKEGRAHRDPLLDIVLGGLGPPTELALEVALASLWSARLAQYSVD